MAKHVSETPATQWLKRRKIAFGEHVYEYVEHGGTAESALQLGVDEHCVIKTLVMQDEAARPLIVLMHGDCTVSTKNLARAIGCKSVEPCSPEVAQRHSGYQDRKITRLNSSHLVISYAFVGLKKKKKHIRY